MGYQAARETVVESKKSKKSSLVASQPQSYSPLGHWPWFQVAQLLLSLEAYRQLLLICARVTPAQTARHRRAGAGRYDFLPPLPSPRRMCPKIFDFH